MKSLKHSIFLLLAAATVLFSSCSKDSNTPTPGTSHKVVFKAVASAGSNITVAVYGYDSEITTATSLSGTTWTSPEITVPAGAVIANAGIDATGGDASATLKVQIYVDGSLKKEGTSSGEILSAHASYNF